MVKPPIASTGRRTIAGEDALAAYLEQIQRLLLPCGLTEEERHNTIAGLVHRALLHHGGGYTKDARAVREATWALLREEGRP